MLLNGLPSILLTVIAIDWAIGMGLDDYWSDRKKLLKIEAGLALGGRNPLETGDETVNRMLMSAKRRELDNGLARPDKFPPTRNFLDAKIDIENSSVYRIIRKMPKGAVLHSHDTAIVSEDFVFNLTYRENLYVCEIGSKPGEKLAMQFFSQPDENCEWRLLSDLRKSPKLEDHYNSRIREQMSMNVGKSSKIVYKDGNEAWKKFMSIFMFITPMLTYRPIYEEHFYRGLQELYDDNVIYLELRTTLPPIYELNGTLYDPIDVVRIYKKVSDRFVEDHENFMGAKIIYAPIKTSNESQFDDYIRVAKRLSEEFPGFVVGFDLVGQEDTSGPLVRWIDRIRTVAPDLPFFFHAGETNWNGMSVDENLIDAVLLNATRIGHGYALVKHPKVMEIARKNKIAIEICPISNQVLRLVEDLRNHPASVLFADDFPIVVSNDDPGLWGAKALSYDFYEAFMGIMSAHSDIRSMKQLAINSIEYSSLNGTEKKRAYEIFNKQWLAFQEDDIFSLNDNVSTIQV